MSYGKEVDPYGNTWNRDPNGGYHLSALASGNPENSYTDSNGLTWYRDPNGGWHLSTEVSGFQNDGSETVNAKSIYSDGGLITSDGKGTLSVKDILVNGTSLSGNYLEKDFNSNQNITLNGYTFGVFNDSDNTIGSLIGSSSDTKTTTVKLRNGTSNDYDIQITSSGGTDGTNGLGQLNITAKSVVISPIDDTDNSNQVATTKYVQDNLAKYTDTTDLNTALSEYLKSTDAASLYVPLSDTSYVFKTGSNSVTVNTSGVDVESSNISLNSSVIKLSDLPTTDPKVDGAIWIDNGFVVMSGSNASLYLEKQAHIISFATTSPNSLEVLSIFTADASYQIPANFVGSIASVGTPPSESYIIDIEVNNSSIGNITISTSGTATFSTTSTTYISIKEGDVISIVAPSTTDPSIKNISLNILLNVILG